MTLRHPVAHSIGSSLSLYDTYLSLYDTFLHIICFHDLFLRMKSLYDMFLHMISLYNMFLHMTWFSYAHSIGTYEKQLE